MIKDAVLMQLELAQLHSRPYRWAWLNEFTQSETALELARSFPHIGFLSSERATGQPGHDKPYRLEHRTLGAAVKSARDDLVPVWRDFLASIESLAYRKAIEGVFRVNLEGAVLDITLWRYGVGCWLGAHTDKADKVITQVFNLNEGWEPQWGGALRILRSANDEDSEAELIPIVNTSAIICRSEQSWHMVTPVQEAAGTTRYRQVLTATFRRSGV